MLVRRRVSFSALAIIASFGAVDIRAQAWLPPKDTMTVALSYQYGFIKQHYFADGSEVDAGHITSHSAALQMSYSLTDRFAMSASLPYVRARYQGPLPHQLPVDGGDYHGTLQDYRLDARYQVTKGAIAFTPFVGMVVPSHDYIYFAHSAVGRDLHETVVGFDEGMTDLFAHFRSCGCPTATYLESRLSYSFVERVLGIRHDHANLDVDFGYFVTDRLGIRALGSYNRTFGGINHDRVNCTWCDGSSPLFVHHDQLLAERHLNLGGGASYALNDKLDAFASAFHTVSGRNGHKMHIATMVGVAWSFAPRGAKQARTHPLVAAR
jgi:hypothetical protein